MFSIYALYIQSLFTEYIRPWPHLGQCVVALSREITICGTSVIAGVRVGEASNSVDLTPLTWSTNRVKSMGQSIIDRSVNKGQRGQSHMAHAICKPTRLCT